MEQKEIQFKIRTPLFIGHNTDENDRQVTLRELFRGQSQNITYHVNIKRAKITANAFRGILRWWFRAWVGYHNPSVNNKSKSHKMEAELFGSTDKASKFKIQILPHKLQAVEQDRQLKAKGSYGTYTFSRGEGKYNGLGYFATNLYNKSKPNRERNHGIIDIFEYYQPNDSFSIRIVAEDNIILIKVLALLWLALQFGGIGSRTRRCFGNLGLSEEILEFKHNGEEFKFFFTNSFGNDEYYARVLELNFAVLKKLFPPFNDSSSKATSFKKHELYLSRESTDDWELAINQAGLAMQYFRAMTEPDYSSLKRIGRDTKSERAIFGLPLAMNYSSIHRSAEINVFDSDGKAHRLGSPIIASTTIIGRQFRTQYLFLDYDYNSQKIKDKKSGKTVRIDTEALDVFKEYLEGKIEIDVGRNKRETFYTLIK